MKKALIISAAFPPMLAGEGDYALHLARHLSGKGFAVHLLTGRQNTGGAEDRSLTVHAVMPGWSWLSLPRFLMFLKQCSPDLIILVAPGWLYDQFHPMTMFAVTMAKSLLKGVSFITQFCYIGDPPERVPPGTRLMRRFVKQWAGPKDVDWVFGTLLRDSDLLSVMSEYDLERFVGPDPALRSRFTVVPPPPILHLAEHAGARAQGRDQLGVKEEDFLFAFFGYVYPGKGVDTLLKAFRELASAKKNARLVMIGGGQNKKDGARDAYVMEIEDCARDMKLLAKELGIDDRVIWAGGYAADSDQASVYLKAADACVLPFDEGVTLIRSTVAAAVTHGLPVITTRKDGLESPFKDRDNVLLCEPKDTRSLLQAMTSLMDNVRLRQDLQAGAESLARDWFSWKRLDAGLGRLLREKENYE